MAAPSSASKGKSPLNNTAGFQSLIVFAVLGLAWLAGFSARLFAVIRFESIIHEFDPWFNYRATHYMVENGFYNFLNWFDERAWYPLGRIVGGTVYPGLMVTSGMIHHILSSLNIPIHIRDVCVFLAPLFSGLTAISMYFFTKEIWSQGAGLLAACFIAIVPGYISRSVAGSYDNEGIAIFALMFTYYLWIKTVKTGSVFWAIGTALAYFYMVSAWGGYVFIINLIPLHVFVLLLMGRYSNRLYTGYCAFYIVGTLCSMQIPFVGFQPIRTSEHMAAAGVFALLNAYCALNYVRSYMTKSEFKSLFFFAVAVCAGIVFCAVVFLTYAGYVAPWSGRFYSLWDTGYAKIHIPIIASVSEHQPTTWVSFLFDLHVLSCVFPAGVWFVIKNINDERVFVVLYASSAIYFAGVMVRLMLTLTPIVCVFAAIAFSHTFENYLKDDPVPGSEVKSSNDSTSEVATTPLKDPSRTSVNPEVSSQSASAAAPNNGQSRQKQKASSPKQQNKPKPKPIKGCIKVKPKAGDKRPKKDSKVNDVPISGNLKTFIILLMIFLLMLFCVHCTWVTSNAYSSPSIVLASYNPDGSRMILDDFREAYYWLRQNTNDEARVMSWWDYGYQIAGMGNKTTLVDNNTWNNSHIALVGKAMSSNESAAFDIMKMLDVDYVLVIFGGVIGYSGDDINKFLWMVRIAEGEHPQDIKESDYFTPNGEFRVDAGGSKTLLHCLMYKLCYYRFGEVQLDYRSPPGFDRTRNVEIGHKNFELEHLEEAYTTEHWLVRVYRVLKDTNVDKKKKLSKRLKKKISKKTARNKKGTLGNQKNVVLGKRKTKAKK